jgi:hypothetical protein
MAPRFSRAIVPSIGLVVSGRSKAVLLHLRVTRGPHTGQAFGCAWNLRLEGSWYSAAQAGHMVKADMVVFGLS